MSGIALALGAIGAGAGLLLGALARRLPEDTTTLVDRVDALLPQTQCAQCGYPGCRPYAEAIVSDQADINQCPPGGEATLVAIADLLGRERKGLDPAFGTPAPGTLVRIDEARCIGCALCLPACPVDAIVGASRFTHTVLAAQCTGCLLCIAPCPVDCIEVVAASARPDAGITGTGTGTGTLKVAGSGR